MKKKKNQNKGQKGYLAWNKKMSICKTLVLFAISFAVYAMGIWSTGSNQNLLTIVAVLGCLPACRSAANLIALLRCHEISESDYRKISAKIRTAESLTDLEFTSYERTYQVQHMALSGVELIGYMADPFADIKGCEKHLGSRLFHGLAACQNQSGQCGQRGNLGQSAHHSLLLNRLFCVQARTHLCLLSYNTFH